MNATDPCRHHRMENSKIKFKKSEIAANILVNTVGLAMGCIILFSNHAVVPGKYGWVKIIVTAGSVAVVLNLLAYLLRLIKSIRNICALEIDDAGICNNISKKKFLRWNEISHFTLKTVQMSSGRHSKISVHTFNPALSMTINTDLLDIDKNELLDVLHEKMNLSSAS